MRGEKISGMQKAVRWFYFSDYSGAVLSEG
jgi:hypothetical protein